MAESIRRHGLLISGEKFPPLKREHIPVHIRFKMKLDRTIDEMQAFEQTNLGVNGPERQKLISDFVANQRVSLGLADTKKKGILPQAEEKIFANMLELFTLKHQGENEDSKPKRGMSIGSLASLGAGKTTIIRTLIDTLKERGEEIVFKEERHPDNPFWRRSQKNKKYMLRSQAHFLLANILFQLKNNNESTVNKSAMTLSDTSSLTDILMWATWYHHMGYFSKKEYESYQRLVELFKTIIPKPDLVLIFVPNSNDKTVVEAYVQRLRRGINNRLKDDKSRKQEEVFTRGIKRLRRQVYIVLTSAISIPVFWGVPVLQLEVDPLEIYSNLEYRQQIVDQIISELADYDQLKEKTKIMYEVGIEVKETDNRNN